MANSYRQLVSPMLKDRQYRPGFRISQEGLSITLNHFEYVEWQDFYIDVRQIGPFSLQLPHATNLHAILWRDSFEMAVFDSYKAHFYGEVPNEWLSSDIE